MRPARPSRRRESRSLSSRHFPFRGQAQQIAEFFWAPIINFARSSCLISFSLASSRWATRRSVALAASGLGPRVLFGAHAASLAATCRRHLFRCELYRPSRRNNAPMAPRQPPHGLLLRCHQIKHRCQCWRALLNVSFWHPYVATFLIGVMKLSHNSLTQGGRFRHQLRLAEQLDLFTAGGKPGQPLAPFQFLARLFYEHSMHDQSPSC